MTNQDSKYLQDKLQEFGFHSPFQGVGDNEKGANRLLWYLYLKNEATTAGDISTNIDVSTARVAVLIKKLKDAELIKITKDANDGRKTIVTISEKGIRQVEDKREKMTSLLKEIVEKVGYKRMQEFCEISKEIKEIVEAKWQEDTLC